MAKTSGIIFFLLMFISCGKSGGGGSSSANNKNNSLAEEISLDAPVPHEALKWDANIKFSKFTRTQENKVLDAVDLIRQVIGSDEFKTRVLNYTYQGKKRFVDNNGLTNGQIYQKIIEGAEKLYPKKNYVMDVTLETYTTDANVIGYTLPTVNKIWMNTRYLNTFTPVQVAANLVHEWLHKLGFGHAYESTPSRPYSVPYAVGYLIRTMAAKY